MTDREQCTVWDKQVSLANKSDEATIALLNSDLCALAIPELLVQDKFRKTNRAAVSQIVFKLYSKGVEKPMKSLKK